MKFQYQIVLSFSLFAISCNQNGSEKTTSQDSTLVITNDTVVANQVDPLAKIHMCTELAPPPPPSTKQNALTNTYYYYQDDRVDTIKTTTPKPRASRLAVDTKYKWRTDTIHVAFLDGDPVVQKKVASVAKQWENYVGIVFDFNPSFPRKDITISFLYTGSWSQIGTYSRKVSPSMNFGWLDIDTPPEEYQRVVLHEFGHALGFIHEQSQPEASIPWDTPAVYKYYMKPPNNWSKQEIDENVFFKYSRAQTNGTSYDTNSIMHYYIPPELTGGRFTVSEKSQLSAQDKIFASHYYPTKNK